VLRGFGTVARQSLQCFTYQSTVPIRDTDVLEHHLTQTIFVKMTHEQDVDNASDMLISGIKFKMRNTLTGNGRLFFPM
jgi:hypothetical protein